jgi:hypothetical protein
MGDETQDLQDSVIKDRSSVRIPEKAVIGNV